MSIESNVNEERVILPLGDSITEGTPFSYRKHLYDQLLDMGIQCDFVGSHTSIFPDDHPGDGYHEGWSGFTTQCVADKISEWLLKYGAPDDVLIHLGTNDLHEMVKRIESIEETKTAMRRIIRALRKRRKDVSIYIAKLPYIEEAPEECWNLMIDSLNDRFSEVIESERTNQSPITSVDMNTGFKPSDFWDGMVHPSEKGAEKMAHRWAEALLQK